MLISILSLVGYAGSKIILYCVRLIFLLSWRSSASLGLAKSIPLNRFDFHRQSRRLLLKEEIIVAFNFVLSSASNPYNQNHWHKKSLKKGIKDQNIPCSKENNKQELKNKKAQKRQN